MLIPACHSLTGVYFLHHLNIAAGNCGQRAVLLVHIPGVHSHRQSLLEKSGVCLLKTASYWGLLTDSLQYDLACRCAYHDQQIVWWDALLLMPVSTHVSLPLSPLRAAARGGGKHSWLKSIHLCIHPHVREVITSTHLWGFGEDYPHPNPFLPDQHQLGFGEGLWTRSTSPAEPIAGFYPEDSNLMRWFTVPMHDCH